MSDSKTKFNISWIELLKEPTMFFSVFLIIIVLMLIIPIPTFLLDFLMSLSILSGLLIILTVSYLKSAVDFSIFPSVLLITTLFRLGINVSSTRLILTQGINFDGKMVRAFGEFVVGAKDASGMIVGVIIFTILTIVQFIVITRGATRVSEVAARFSLDSMPSKYMAIDMDLQNGIIDEQESIRRRNYLQEESSFYGSMDGASKFVQGDVIVGIIITIINIIGGISVGMLTRGESFNDAIANYIPLTIGDGLVSQIPSLLISTATGLIVTRSQTKEAIGSAVWKQISGQYKVFFISAGTLGVMALLPGFPHIILFLLAIALAFAGYLLYNAEKKISIEKADKQIKKEEPKGPENVSSLLKIDQLSLHIGYELIQLVDKAKGAPLLNSITNLRRNLAIELGIIVPPIRIQDNMSILPNEYSFKIRGQEVGRGSVKINYLMAMGENLEKVEGEKTIEPAFNLPAVWIRESDREKYESQGYTVVDIPAIITTHIQEIIKTHSDEILGREEVNQIIDNLRKDYPSIVDDTIGNNNYSKSQIQKILQNLLKEQVSIKDMVTILETLSEHTPQTPIFELLEYVRQSLRRVICSKYLDEKKHLHILKLNPKIEQEIYKNLSFANDGSPIIRLSSDYLHKLQSAIKEKVVEMFNKGFHPVIVTQPPIRRALWEITRHINKNIAVLSTRELLSDIEIILFNQIELETKEKVNV